MITARKIIFKYLGECWRRFRPVFIEDSLWQILSKQQQEVATCLTLKERTLVADWSVSSDESPDKPLKEKTLQILSFF